MRKLIILFLLFICVGLSSAQVTTKSRGTLTTTITNNTSDIGWQRVGNDVYLFQLTDSVGVGTNDPKATLHLGSAQTIYPILLLHNTNANAKGPLFEFWKESASPADNDSLGTIIWFGETDTGALSQYGDLTIFSADVSNGSESGYMIFNVEYNGSPINYLSLGGDTSPEITFNESLADVDFRVESSVGDSALFVEGSSGIVAIGTRSPRSDADFHILATDVQAPGVNNPNIIIESEQTGATGAGILFVLDSTSPADADEAMGIVFAFDDDGGAETTGGKISGGSSDVTNTTEDGYILIETLVNGTLQDVLSANETPATPSIILNKEQADIDIMLSSTASPNSIIVQGSDGAVGIGTASPVAGLDISTVVSNRLINISPDVFVDWYIDDVNPSRLKMTATSAVDLGIQSDEGIDLYIDNTTKVLDITQHGLATYSSSIILGDTTAADGVASNGTVAWRSGDLIVKKGGTWTSTTQATTGDFAQGGDASTLNRKLGNLNAHDLVVVVGGDTSIFMDESRDAVVIGKKAPELTPDIESLTVVSTTDNRANLVLMNENQSPTVGHGVDIWQADSTATDDMIIGWVQGSAYNDGTFQETFAGIEFYADDVTNTDEAGRIDMFVLMNDTERSLLRLDGFNGASVDDGEIRVNVDNQDVDFVMEAVAADSAFVMYGSNGGITVGAPTGGNKGAGTINAKGLYDDNTLLTDYVFEPAYQDTMLAINEMEEFYIENKHLPTIDGRDAWKKKGKPSVGQLTNQLWETIEVQAIYIARLNKRVEELEKRLEK